MVARAAAWSDKERPRRRRQRPFLSHNCPSPRLTDDTPVHFLSAIWDRVSGQTIVVVMWGCGAVVHVSFVVIILLLYNIRIRINVQASAARVRYL